MTIFKIEWKTQDKSVLAWCGVIVLILSLFMAVFPTMQSAGMTDIVNTKLSAMPQDVLKIFNLNDGSSLLEVMGYFAYVFQYVFIASAIYAVLIGAQALIKEESDGTIEFLYAQPMTRKELVGFKMVANLAILATFWVITFIFAAIIILIFRNETDKLGDIFLKLIQLFLNDGLILVALLAIGFFFSTIIKSSKQATGLALGFVFGTYVIGILSELNDKVSFLKYISLLHYGVPANLLKEWMGWTYLIILIVVITVFSLLSIFMYQKKDLKI